MKSDLARSGGSEIALKNRLRLFTALDDIVFLNVLRDQDSPHAGASAAA